MDMQDSILWRDFYFQFENTKKKRGDLIKQQAKKHGISTDTVYNRLKFVRENLGQDDKRKARKDAGKTTLDHDILLKISSMLKLGVRKNGKITMDIPTARQILEANGDAIPVSNNRLATLLRGKGLDIKTQSRPSPHVMMQSLYTNHVHQVDPSLCLLYYLNGKQQMKRLKQQWISDAEAYKNKPETLEKIGKLKVWRYVLVDHFSHTIIVKYYQAKGESQENLFDFLLYAWAKTDGRVFHGVPDILYWDKGSANTSAGIKNFAEALQVTTLEHQAGNPRAKGAVELANNIVEKQFEARLRFEPVNNVDELNFAVEAWSNAFNSNSIPHKDTRLNRPNMAQPIARYGLWQTIRSEQLRLLPGIELCRMLFTSKPLEKTVKGALDVTFKHPKAERTASYSLKDIPDIYVGAKVKVSAIIYGNNQILVKFKNFAGELTEHIISPLPVNELSGFPIDAPVFGQEYASQPTTSVEKVGQQALETAFPDMSQEEREKAIKNNAVPFGGLDAHSHLKDVWMPDYMQKKGTFINVPDRMHIEDNPLSVTEICKRLVADLGTTEKINYYQHIKAEYPQGILPDEYPQLLNAISELLNPTLRSIAK
ncbi:MAG: transposase family protein [Pseudomonadota bacterium]